MTWRSRERESEACPGLGRRVEEIDFLIRSSVRLVKEYPRDYERVKLLLKQGTAVSEISSLIGRGERVVLEYVEPARQYHPELFTEAD